MLSTRRDVTSITHLERSFELSWFTRPGRRGRTISRDDDAINLAPPLVSRHVWLGCRVESPVCSVGLEQDITILISGLHGRWGRCMMFLTKIICKRFRCLRRKEFRISGRLCMPGDLRAYKMDRYGYWLAGGRWLSIVFSTRFPP